MSEKKKNAKDIIDAFTAGEVEVGEQLGYEHAGATGTMLKVGGDCKTAYSLHTFDADGNEIAHVHGENMECAFVIAVPEGEMVPVQIEGLVSPHHLKIAGIALLSYLEDFGVLNEVLMHHAVRKISSLAERAEKEEGASGLPFRLRGFGDFDPSDAN